MVSDSREPPPPHACPTGPLRPVLSGNAKPAPAFLLPASFGGKIH